MNDEYLEEIKNRILFDGGDKSPEDIERTITEVTGLTSWDGAEFQDYYSAIFDYLN